jgi:hypothetical protein
VIYFNVGVVTCSKGADVSVVNTRPSARYAKRRDYTSRR